MATHKHFSSPPLPEPLFYELAATVEFDRFFFEHRAGCGVDGRRPLRRPDTPPWGPLRYQFFGALTTTDGRRDLIPAYIVDPSVAAGLMLATSHTRDIADSAHGPFAARELAVLGIRARLMVPMRVAGRVEGALVRAWQARPLRAPGHRKRRLVEAFAAFISLRGKPGIYAGDG